MRMPLIIENPITAFPFFIFLRKGPSFVVFGLILDICFDDVKLGGADRIAAISPLPRKMSGQYLLLIEPMGGFAFYVFHKFRDTPVRG